MPSIVQLGVLRPRALRREVRLLAGLVAADVDAIDEHAGHAAHQRERIARGRDLRAARRCVKLVAVPVALVSTIGDSPVTVIVSATVGELQRDRQIDVAADRDDDAFAHDVARSPAVQPSPCRGRAAGSGTGTCPASSVTAVCVRSEPWIVTVTPGSTAFCSSVTVPDDAAARHLRVGGQDGDERKERSRQ